MKAKRFIRSQRISDGRDLHLKIRVLPLRRMRVKALRRLVERALASGVVPPGIEIRWIDWAKEAHRYETKPRQRNVLNEGHIPEPVLDELRAWYGAMLQAQVRFAKVRKDGEE